ncbi:phage portal protein [Glutamicibacter sp. NPDC087673]|uniref:phage portal protein n=1 Tax=Glutamicibacter sp. NPDC087673 TaxID=3363997 RepID=UPI003802685A
MGIANLFRKSGPVYNATTGVSSGYTSISSPWANSARLAVVQTPEAIGEGLVTLGEAMKVPPVARGLGLVTTVGASFDLVTDTGAGGPVWLDSTFGAITARHRTAFTFQDLMMTGASCWWISQRGDDGYPLELERIPRELWSLDEAFNVQTIDGTTLDPRRVVYIPALVPGGFLEYGADSVREYVYLGKQIRNRARVGKPLLNLHIADQYEPTDEELDQVADEWAEARQAPNGAFAFTPWWLDVKELGSDEVSPLADARNEVRLDVANFLNINAALLDGNNGTSDTYSNTLQNMNEFLVLTMGAFITAVEQRLSQDDVTPPGMKIRYDTAGFDQAEDAKGNAGAAVSTPHVGANNE